MHTAAKNSRPIGVFDSGVGGLSVLKELRRVLPHEDFVFLADQKNMPYGEKSKKELIKFTYRITDYLIKTHNIKLMVVACNTATCNTIEELRRKYAFPIVGTVPAVKLAAEKTRNKSIAVISTPATSKSKMLKDLIKDYCKNIKVLNINGKYLADRIEEGKTNEREINALLLKYLKPPQNGAADYLVLGSTHYPFIQKPIQKIVGPSVKIIDSGKAIAKQTKSLLLAFSLKNTQQNKGKVSYFSTGDPKKFTKTANLLLNTNYNSIALCHKIDL